jgi:hypothetical protein
LRAGGRLSPEAPGPDEGTDAFVFDPLDPFLHGPARIFKYTMWRA